MPYISQEQVEKLRLLAKYPIESNDNKQAIEMQKIARELLASLTEQPDSGDVAEAVKLVRMAQAIIIKIAADLATGEGLMSFYAEDHDKKIPVWTLRKIEKQHEAMNYRGRCLKNSCDLLTEALAKYKAQGVG